MFLRIVIVNDLNPGGGELNPEGVLEDHQRSDVQDRPMLLSIKMVVDEDPPFESDCPSTPSSMWSCRSSRLNPYSRRLINTPTFKIDCPFFSRRGVV
jgi:hypothetical protein